MNMRVLTVRPPWAAAIAYGQKDVENRDWSTAYRGPLAICAGLNLDRSARELYPELFENLPPVDAMPRGGVVAVVDLVDVVRDSPSKWAQPDRWHWVLANPRPLRQMHPLKGALGLQHLDEETVAAVLEAISGGTP